MKATRLAFMAAVAILIAAFPTRAKRRKPAMVKVTVANVGTLRGSHVVLLQYKVNTLLPIWIGAREAQAISMGIQGTKAVRPLTHNLLLSCLKSLRAKIQRVEVVTIRNNVFIGRMVLKSARGKVHYIDARPSDLIALAVASKRPIYVALSVINKAGIKRNTPQKGIQVF